MQKILIAVFLSREFKHDETNIAWWSGKWYGRGLGSSALSQPAREYVVKIVEMSLWSSDFLIGHLLLIVLTPPIFIPFVDRLHSTMLCKPSISSLLLPSPLIRVTRLAATLEADSSSVILHEAEAPTSLDRTWNLSDIERYGTDLLILDREVHLPVRHHGVHTRCFGHPSYVDHYMQRFHVANRYLQLLSSAT